MQFAENIHANWQERYCFIITMPDPIQPEKLMRKFKNYFLNIRLYSTDLAPSDFHLFGPLKNHRGAKRFTDGEDVEMEVRKWLRQQSKVFYVAGFYSPVKRWDKCINFRGGYFEK
jgi:hypothetical protein